MRLSWCPQTWYSAWCSLTTTRASLGPASPTPPIRPIPPAKRARPSTLYRPPTAPTASRVGTHETNKSMCLPPVTVLTVLLLSDSNMCWCSCVCLYVLLVCLSVRLTPFRTVWLGLPNDIGQRSPPPKGFCLSEGLPICPYISYAKNCSTWVILSFLSSKGIFLFNNVSFFSCSRPNQQKCSSESSLRNQSKSPLQFKAIWINNLFKVHFETHILLGLNLFSIVTLKLNLIVLESHL